MVEISAKDAPDLQRLQVNFPNLYNGQTRDRRLRHCRGSAPHDGKLFKTYVLTPSQADGLSVRAVARAAYSDFKQAIKSWEMPAVVPPWMSDWKFADVTEFMTRAKATLARRDALDVEAATNNLTVKADLQKMFESATAMKSFDDMDKVIETQLVAIHRLAQVQPLVVAPRNFYQRVGLRGQNPDVDFEAARPHSTKVAWTTQQPKPTRLSC